LDKLRPFPVELEKNLEEWLRVELTYNSNAIEGNTLTRKETAMVLEKGLTVGGKSLRDQLEAVNYGKAISCIQQLAEQKKDKVTLSDILDIHRIILSGIDDMNAGRLRSIPVRIAGSTVIMPNPMKVPELMDEFIKWLNSSINNLPMVAVEAHYKLVSIHPFVDGNGRTARLLMNLLLLRDGYPQVVIKNEDRIRYISAIEKGQLGGGLDDYYEFMLKVIEDAIDVYLEAMEEVLS